ncbi:transposase family protein [Streptomyces violascens]|uniref:transposase family protein n=1 Tax=Streptomyces violascens TaxID=67381 RepID=UPI0037A0D6D8
MSFPGRTCCRGDRDGRRGCCPGCGCPSSRVHDRYPRQLQDVPLAARPVRIMLEVRWFVCGNRPAHSGRSPSRSRASQARTPAAPTDSAHS